MRRRGKEQDNEDEDLEVLEEEEGGGGFELQWQIRNGSSKLETKVAD